LQIGLDELPSWRDGFFASFFPLGELFTSWTKTERASGGTYGLSNDQLTCEGVTKGPLVWALHSRVCDDGKRRARTWCLWCGRGSGSGGAD
jgi:hypothetical protein